MVFSRQQQSYGECESDYTDDDDRFDSDDSQTDPTYDITEGTRSKLSSLSMKKKSKPRLDEEMIENVEEPDILQVVGPEQVELDQKDQKSYETVEERVKAGQLEKLKVDQCKVYLRKHGLRLTGNKDILIQRIREHLDILDGGGEKKYPASSFVVNCKGDACAGDVVLFEQNVYEMFNIAARSASGAPCGTRLVAGRILKESYGAAKQQHTFTIEVLWSKGVKPLSPLHQLLIKGRNLYRLKTMRQEWEDETERKKLLSEKHARGSVARSNREARVQVRVLQKMRKAHRKMRKAHGTLEAEKQKKQIPSSLPIPSNNMAQPPQLPDETLNNFRHPNLKPMDGMEITSCKDKSSVTPGGPVSVHTRPVFSLDDAVPLESDHPKRQPLTSMNRSLPGNRPTTATDEDRLKFKNFVHRAPNHENNNPSRRPPRAGPGGGDISNASNPACCQKQTNVSEERRVAQPKNAHAHNLNVYSSRGKNIIAPKNPVEGHLQEKQQPCRYYAQGRCYYGNKCKWLHEGSGDQKLSH